MRSIHMCKPWKPSKKCQSIGQCTVLKVIQSYNTEDISVNNIYIKKIDFKEKHAEMICFVEFCTS